VAQLIEKGSAVIAPVTVLTALFVYFGFVRTSAFFGYFGVSLGVLKFSVQDYLLRSVDVSFGAMARLAIVGGSLIAFDRGVAVILARRVAADRMDRALRWTFTASGALLVVLGLVSAVSQAVAVVLDPLIGSVLLALGVVMMLRFGSSLFGGRDGSPRRTDTLTAVVFVISGFWATTIYAQDLGLEAARSIDASVGKLSLVSVFSAEPLDLPGRDVIASRIIVEDQEYRYRYSGLSLLTYSNDRWFLITGRLSNGYHSSVTILRDSEAIRVEVAAGA